MASIPTPLLLGLIGAPINSSAAPAMHRAAGNDTGFDVHYQLIEQPGADSARLRAMLEGVRLLGFAGVNVTFPYKEAVVPLLDALAPGIAALGAVNTVVVRGRKLTGYNTDASGFARGFREAIGNEIAGPVALVGAGGVGRAIGFALAELGAPEVRILDRDRTKALALAEALAPRLSAVVHDDLAAALATAVGVINATPAGMLPDRSCPVPPALLHAGLWVSDAVYTPLWTPLLLAARACGARVMSGRALAIHQAVDAFALFSGRDPGATAIAAAFDAVMRQREAAGGAG